MNGKTKPQENIDLNNPELRQALRIIQDTRRSLFLTGKAGTGKSTFLRYIAKTTKKKNIILAPTGLAAINAGGSTLHSFFKLPFYPLLPEDSNLDYKNIRGFLKYNQAKIKLINEIELIIIDEISMVRSDIIDFVDKILRVYCHNRHEPFGGKQILFVGDVYQLEPVLREEDSKLLEPFYKSKFFFDAKIFDEFQLVCIELKKVYRQTEQKFVNILDNIRTAQVTTTDLKELNKRVGAELEKNNNLSITLSAHRDTVDFLNNEHLKRIPSEQLSFIGTVNGEFPESSLPAPLKLDLKVGAQVLFVKNDPEKRWVNGTLGQVISMSLETNENPIICIHTDKGEDVEVYPEKWSNIKYTFNSEEKKIEAKEIGSFQQYPLRLAWAITVHKSQGLTFSQVKIDFTGGVFAAGQTYVALSRCRSLEGLSLKSPILQQDIFVRPAVLNFAKKFNSMEIFQEAINDSLAKQLYHETVDAYNKGDMEKASDAFYKAIRLKLPDESPTIKRFVRQRLNKVNTLIEEKRKLEERISEKDAFLRKLAVEYFMLGKESEKEKMYHAALLNFKKAIKLYPDYPEAIRKIKKLETKKQ